MKLSKNQLTGIIFILLGLGGALATSRIPFKTNLATAGDVGPRCFPYIACAGIVLCGIGIIATCAADPGEGFLSREETGKALCLMAVLTGYLLAIKYAGFLLSTPIILFVLVRMLKGGRRTSLAVDLVFSVLFSCGIYYIFVKLLKIMLPQGLLF